ncbi:uncharacterized protein LOC136075876 [Hydra vulgaris]|uniref:Uncharacterized protein LOC136075876 n=1 Tax=Hydra vulgaris TaxID=6087 RepID=A0ABM4B942_HYDVU
MIKCLFGGPEFICRAQPVANCSSEFQFAQCQQIVHTINNIENSKTLVIITGGNRVNQRFFGMFKTVDSKPWLTRSGIYLFYDYVHLLKSIRNNWLTEKTDELQFLNSKELAWLSGFCLSVFCEETVAALRTHLEIENKAFEDTAVFIEKIMFFSNVVNVKAPGAGIRFRNELCGEIHSVGDQQLQLLRDIAELSNFMKPTGKRVKQLTLDTSNAICYGFIDLVESLLSNGAKYVLLGWFSTDPIEKAFCKLRQGSGDTYFINAKSVIEKINIQHTKLILQLDIPVDGIDGDTCDICFRDISTDEKELLDNIHDLESSVNKSTLVAIVYIAGYVQKSEIKVYDDSTNYYYKYGSYLYSVNRGGLEIPSEFCVTQFQFIAAKYKFKITKKQ